MTQVMRKCITVMLIFGMLAAGALPMHVEAAAKRFAKITELSGTVSVQKNGAEKTFKAFKGMSLAEGDSIETGIGSSATLEVDADRTVKIGDNTKVDLTELKGSVNKTKTSVKLWGGKVYVEVNKKLGKDERFDISTPTAVMGVRGTKFYVTYEKNTIRVGVVEGKVDAKVYTFEAKPGQEPTLKTVETMILPSQEALIPEDAANSNEVKMQEVELKDLDLFILQEIMKNPEALSPETLKEIEDEIKRKEAEEAKQVAEQLEAVKKLEEQQNQQQPVYENPTPPPSTPPSSGSISNNQSNSNGTSVSAVYVNGSEVVGQVLTATTVPENATVSYQWMRSDSPNGTYVNVSGQTNQTYTLSASDIDMYLKVVVTGTGNFSGTVTSQRTGKVTDSVVSISQVTVTGTPEIGQILTLNVTMSDGQPAGSRVEYFAVVHDSAVSSVGTGTIPVGCATLTIPPEFQLDAGGNASMSGKYIDYGVRLTGNQGSAVAAPRVGPVEATLLGNVLVADPGTIEAELKALYTQEGYYVTDIIAGNGLGYYRLIHNPNDAATTAAAVKTAVDKLNLKLSQIKTASVFNDSTGALDDGAIDALMNGMLMEGYYSGLSGSSAEIYVSVFNNGANDNLDDSMATYQNIQDFVYMVKECIAFEDIMPGTVMTSWIANADQNVVTLNLPEQFGACAAEYYVGEVVPYEAALNLQIPYNGSLVGIMSKDRTGLSGTGKQVIEITYSRGIWTISRLSDLNNRLGVHPSFLLELPNGSGDATITRQ